MPCPLSIDNRPWENDYYARHYSSPEGENGKFKSSGGMMRQRPLSRPVIDDPNWFEGDQQTQVRMASAIGMDGFVWNIFPNYLEKGKALLRAAAAVDPQFKIVLMPDMIGFSKKLDQMKDIIVQLSQHESVYRLPDGRVVLAPYCAMLQTPQWWQQTLDEFQAKGLKWHCFPYFKDGNAMPKTTRR